MTDTYDCSEPEQRRLGLGHAARAVRAGQLVVLPTDTVYGIGCDAFDPVAVASLLRAKGRGPDMPVPVLVGSESALDGLARVEGTPAHALAKEFWPGALTLICRSQPSLHWDLGETGGTVALRMPEHPLALDLLRDVGPMAVSSANRSGYAPAMTAEQAVNDLGPSVTVYLDGGSTDSDVSSTILDLTATPPRIIRQGALDPDRIRAIVPDLQVPDAQVPDAAAAS